MLSLTITAHTHTHTHTHTHILLQIHVLQEDWSDESIQLVTSCWVTDVNDISVDRAVPLYCTIVSHRTPSLLHTCTSHLHSFHSPHVHTSTLPMHTIHTFPPYPPHTHTHTHKHTIIIHTFPPYPPHTHTHTHTHSPTTRAYG